MLYERLRDLNEASLVVQGDNGEYELTSLGAELGESLQPLDAWARRGSRRLSVDAGRARAHGEDEARGTEDQ